MIKLHLGCGKRDFGSDWIHIDGSHEFPHITHHDIINLPTDLYGKVDLIYASHVLEYFDREEAEFVLKTWYSFLKFGGVLRLAVPDFEKMANLYTHNKKKYPLSSFLGPIYGKMLMDENYIYHKTIYDYDSLEMLLKTRGFNEVRYWYWWEVDHGKFDDHSQAYIPHMNKETGELISLNVEAIK